MTQAAYPAVFETYRDERDRLKNWAHRHFVEEFDLPMGRLVDVACAEGFWADVFVDFGYEAHAFDFLPLYIENGRERYPRVEFKVADIYGELPYEPESFDVVFVRGIPQFSYEDLSAMKEAIANLLPLSRGTTLLSFYSTQDGVRSGVYGGKHYHHPHWTLRDAAEEVAPIKKWATVGNYLQVAL